MQTTWLQAANMALREEMARDDSVFVMGEDVEAALFGLSAGLVAEFGQERVRNTPIVEETIVGAGVGAAMCGLRPFVDLNIATFAYTAFDQIVNQVAKNRFLFGGQTKLPMVIFLNEFHRSYTAAQHTDRPHGLFMAMPGLKVLAPGTPADAKGLIKSAVRSDDPVMVFSDMTSWNRKGEVPEDPEFLVPIGPARVAGPVDAGPGCPRPGRARIPGGCQRAAARPGQGRGPGGSGQPAAAVEPRPRHRAADGQHYQGHDGTDRGPVRRPQPANPDP